ncbi:MAG: pyruvate/2-oxoglutarate/acetoin dehydrogenase E1 component/TPP-dependent pyruvate [Arcticibacterium sp.]|jgi:pyruvate/2-oxoglutarate/acetoin dehydrogenase E1 component/TPP-dependent pyruvate/acetoin dehydrogenase alpha subunit
MELSDKTKEKITFDDFKQQIIEDYKIAVTSRECSLLGRREVLTGKAKFGIFGDGKELPQIAMAKAFEKGDFRSGYYRDQTFMMAIGVLKPKHFFHGLYATTDIEKEPMSAGRQMGGHFVTHSLNEDGSWKDLTAQKNSSADISPTAAQMPRLLGLAQASKVYRNQKNIQADLFSNQGNEVAWGTIGNASTSEGIFFETINAGGVLQVPMVVSIWDDEYGISVHAKHQTTKENISEILKGFQKEEDTNGYEIFKVAGWDYTNLIKTYKRASEIARETHIPVIIHVNELTQPQGHSTSGSHERYKSDERLLWEKEQDCNVKFKEWILENDFADLEVLTLIEKEIKKEVRNAKNEAWAEFLAPHIVYKKELVQILKTILTVTQDKTAITSVLNDLISIEEPIKKDLASKARLALRGLIGEPLANKVLLKNWLDAFISEMQPKFSAHLYSENLTNATLVKGVVPQYAKEAPLVDGRLIIRDNFDALLNKYPEFLIFGEDSGTIGDVNQGLEGLQKKYGEQRVADTGIRETTIVGQGIGMALRGLRPIAEIQYLDYMLYALQTLSDDLASLRYRTLGKQKAPLIIRTRGHRLEGIWHSGSQMGGLIHFLRGMYILTPRNMTVAAGFYNTLMKSDEPALVIESLNGYRLKEPMPSNLSEICTPIGIVEIIKKGTDITVISYGSTLRIVEQVAQTLLNYDIDIELIDAQSLLPFDISGETLKSIQKTNRLMVIDEDVPGGCSAYIVQEIIDKQGGFKYLDGTPKTITAKAHRPAYASDGDYFSKPNAEDIFEAIYGVMHESNPSAYPAF